MPQRQIVTDTGTEFRSSEFPGPAAVVDKKIHNTDGGIADVRSMGEILVVRMRVIN
jgi:hypothetical protein